MNEIEQKEIETMAREIQKSVDGCAKYWATLIAKHLIEQDYRQVKDKVVLTREEFEELRQERSDYITELQETHNENCRLRIELEDIRKETAREILATIKSYDGWNELQRLRNEIAEQYGVNE